MKSFSRIFSNITVTFLLVSLVMAPVFTDAQTASSTSTAAQQAALQAQYDALQTEIAQWQGIVDDTRAKAGSLQGDITGLTAKIKAAQLTIQAKSIAIAQLAVQISVKDDTISQLNDQITAGKQSLAQLIKQTNELDSFTLVDVILSSSDISDFFQDVDSFDSIQSAMKDKFTAIATAEGQAQSEEDQLDVQKNQTTDAKEAVETQKATIAQSQAEKQQLLAVTDQNEVGYQQILADRQAKAAAIRAALFHLRDTQGISFGDALNFANVASQKTGVDPALILAILTQESDLGANQGSCLVTDITTGDGVGKNTGTAFQKVMKAPRDTVPFQAITTRLGINWQNQPVSCPPSTTYTASRGYGGGMGPSQFIPSTWELFKARVGAMAGVSADLADPWDPQDAFIATAIYMSDLGAAGGSYTAERNAACKYYSGASCQPGRKPANTFYGDQVMATAAQIQTSIDFLKGI